MVCTSMVMMPSMTNRLNPLPMRLNPHGTAMNGTLQQVSGAIGSAVLLTIMTKRTEINLLTSDATQSGMNEQQIMNVAMLDGINFAFLISTIIAGVAFVLTLFIKRVTPPPIEEMQRMPEDFKAEPAPTE